MPPESRYQLSRLALPPSDTRQMVDLSAHDSRKWLRLLTPVVWPCDGDEAEFITTRPRIQTQRHFDSKEQLNVVDAYRQGKTMNEVARQFGLHRTTVRAMLDRAGVSVRPREMSPAQVGLATKLYGDGLSLKQVGERLGFNAQTIANRLVAAGVRMRSARG